MPSLRNSETTRRCFIAGLGAASAFTSRNATALPDDWVLKQMNAARIPGLAVGLAKDGRVVGARGYGYADLGDERLVSADTMFHIASITKTVTASAAMLLVDDGLIALDDPIAAHLDFPIAGDPDRAITFQHLLTHTSGVSDAIYYEVDFRRHGSDSEMPLAAFLREYLAPGGRYAGSGNIATPAGSRWDYSNIGYGLLGHLIGRIAGQDMRRMTQDRLFQPLGLRNVAWTIADVPASLRATPYDIVEDHIQPVEPVGFPDWPAGMMRASVRDLTHLVAAAANGGATLGTRIMSAGAAEAMMTMQRPSGLPDWLTGQGLGWQQSLLDSIPRINHWGGDPGVFTMAYIDPDRRSGVVLLSNLSATPESRTAMKAIAARSLADLS